MLVADGKHHFTVARVEHDRLRDRYLRERGYAVLRIPSYDVILDEGKVMLH